MACSRNCAGTPLCQALNLCCFQMRLDCGKECAGVPEGYGSWQLDAAGNLVVCTNVGGVCSCTTIVGTAVDTVVDNGDGTWTHTSIDGTPVTLDVCELIQDAYAQTPWVDLTPVAGWADAVGYQDLEYRCLCTGEVQLRGCIEATPTNGEVPETIAALPATQNGNSCRPPATVRFGDNCTPIEIDSAGNITTSPSTSDGLMRCFDGINFAS